MGTTIPRFQIIPRSLRDKKNPDPILRSRKYRLLERYIAHLPISVDGFKFGHLRGYGNRLWLDEGFTWDGASGPAIDTATFLVPSAVHDALYFLIKNGFFDGALLSKRMNAVKRSAFRKLADANLMEMCLEYGMHPIRAWYVYFAVRIFGGLHMKFN